MTETTDKRFRAGNEFVIALTKPQYEAKREYWQGKAQEQADARQNDVVIITEDETPFRAYPREKGEQG